MMDDYIQSLSVVTGIGQQILLESTLSLEESDVIYEEFISAIKSIANNNYTDGFTKFFVKNSEGVEAHLANVTKFVINESRVYLFTKLSDVCGAIEADCDSIIPNIAAIIDYDGDSCKLVSQDLTRGIMIDFYIENDNQEYFEFIAYHPSK